MPAWLWVIIAFVSGSLPLAPLLGRLVLRRDIRQYGDGNPGATNLIRAGSLPLGVLAMILDGLKAAIPVGIAYQELNNELFWMIAVAMAPLFGHAFSPFLGGKGGKCIAATFGVWTGLTMWFGPLLLGALSALFSIMFANSSWAFLAALAGLAVGLLVWRPDPLLLLIFAGNFAFYIWRSRNFLLQPPGLRSEKPRISR